MRGRRSSCRNRNLLFLGGILRRSLRLAFDRDLSPLKLFVGVFNIFLIYRRIYYLKTQLLTN